MWFWWFWSSAYERLFGKAYSRAATVWQKGILAGLVGLIAGVLIGAMVAVQMPSKDVQYRLVTFAGSSVACALIGAVMGLVLAGC